MNVTVYSIALPWLLLIHRNNDHISTAGAEHRWFVQQQCRWLWLWWNSNGIRITHGGAWSCANIFQIICCRQLSGRGRWWCYKFHHENKIKINFVLTNYQNDCSNHFIQIHSRSDDNDDDSDLMPFNFVQFNLMPQFCFLAFSSFDSLLAPFDLPQQLPSPLACWHNVVSEIGRRFFN